VSPSRLRKRIARALMVSWREQPTRYDIEAVQANTRRVGLVIRVRWALLVVLVLYSLLAGAAYMTVMPLAVLASHMLIPALALCFVALYNTFYQLNYRRLGNITVWNNLQLALDALVVTVLVYYSGGVSSWFWSMYSLFILEAAFILPKRRDTWGLAAVCVLLLGAIYSLELLGVVPHVVIPFASAEEYRDSTYVAIRYLWQVAVLAGTAAVATQLVGEQRAEAAGRQSLSVLDEATGLYSRAYFLRALGAEIRRAQRDARPLHVILIDIDRFGDFNRRFGIDAGDGLLSLVSAAITACVSKAGDMMVTANLAARYGGEEFAILLAEDQETTGPPQTDDALRLADCLRLEVGKQKVDGAGITVSVGVASMPADGSSSDELLDAADDALSAAKEAGGDRVAPAPAVASADAPVSDRAREGRAALES
jgi:diguanylate cyclase (GGDEF)-like protein